MDSEHEEYGTIVEKARARLELGNPPNKTNEPNLGNPLNWEMCLHFCVQAGRSLIVCSNDGDYATTHGDKRVPNHYLADEFHRLMGDEYTFEVTADLSIALKRLREIND